MAQIDSVPGEIDQNLNNMRIYVKQAHEQEVDLLVFPELYVSGYSLGQISEEVSLAPSDPRLKPLLEDTGAMSITFGLHEDGGLRTYNSAVYFEAGRLAHVHRKLYLPTYGAFEERKHFSPGQSMCAFNTKHGAMAMMVCNDAWQSVLPFLAVQDGAQILLIPTNSADSRFSGRVDNVDYWHGITQFYARMFQSVVVFVNRVGCEGEFQFWGRSHIAGPSGEIIAEAPCGEPALIVADIDLQEVRRQRRRVPLIKEARLSLLCREFDRLAQNGGDL
ncbi:MAG TPA: nitrilase-related carbon-nitrogen hydrolase [Salinisphaera sp.]|nr:nitrilase-related carbon-nitrogen hydrolase [Salinisphaera sp.]